MKDVLSFDFCIIKYSLRFQKDDVLEYKLKLYDVKHIKLEEVPPLTLNLAKINHKIPFIYNYTSFYFLPPLRPFFSPPLRLPHPTPPPLALRRPTSSSTEPHPAPAPGSGSCNHANANANADADASAQCPDLLASSN